MIPWPAGISQDELEALQLRIASSVKVDVESGCWNWVRYCCKSGYGQIKAFGRMWKAHRVAYQLYVGSLSEEQELDHKCRNRKCVNPKHLRPCVRENNCVNTCVRRDSRSGVKGVRQRSQGGKWEARISCGKKQIYLGRFDSLDDAIRAHKSAAHKLHGDFAYFKLSGHADDHP